MFRLFSLIFALVSGLPQVGSAETIRAVTSDFLSPLSIGPEREDPGFNVELMQAIAQRAGLDLEIEWMPWKRAQAVVAQKPGLLLFGATRTAAREERYEWVTPLITAERVFITAGDQINDFEGARGLGLIAARSIYRETLLKMGFPNVEEGHSHSNYQKLKSGRVDAIFTISVRARYIWEKELGFADDAFTVGRSVSSSDVWLAASKGYDRETARRLHEASLQIRSDGTFEKLHEKYFGNLPVVELARPDQVPTTLAD
ncbi:substrate-binding periplasmic protein [Jannaschia aquimarina]|uniref:ArtI protein n=1 Tax=Jannaschia aquimarina TaxID=935700 RepID=A0A0D1EEQ9_9RHOB|nr:transporter substrate-binding domain-containing protein [Jannaschia aquimarina]KIT14355.1 putative ABC transporter arginine-binding protein 2 precursor [Jannaschia aquimarina]SNS86855.1 amino acid ABC transporter substrate-binding protein, PAAT family [Jannaschia aquimarina]